jgi:hypothetical protein
MKTTEFLKESVDQQEYNDEAGMAKNSLHTIVRVATHLERELGDNENLPEWVQEKIGAIKEMMVTVMDYMISQHEMGQQQEMPGFDSASAEQQFAENLEQDIAEDSHMFKGPHGRQDIERNGNVTRVTRRDWIDPSSDSDKTNNKGGKHFSNTKLKTGGSTQGSTGHSSLNNMPGGSRRTMPRLDHDANDKHNYDFREGRAIKEEASAGATGSPSVAVSMQTLGEKGSFSRREVNKKLSGYGNQLTRGGPVKVKAVK